MQTQNNNTEKMYRLMNHDNVNRITAPHFESFTLAEHNERFETNYQLIQEAIDDDPEYLYTEEEMEDWLAEYTQEESQLKTR